MPHPTRQNVAAYLQDPAGATMQSLIVAGSGTDNQETNGAGVDRQGYYSARVVAAVEAVVAAGKKCDVKITVQHSADNSTWADAPAAQQPSGGANTTLVSVTSGGGGTVEGIDELDIDLSGLNRYIRVQMQPDCDASGTDTAAAFAFIQLFGSDKLPV